MAREPGTFGKAGTTGKAGSSGRSRGRRASTTTAKRAKASAPQGVEGIASAPPALEPEAATATAPSPGRATGRPHAAPQHDAPSHDAPSHDAPEFGADLEALSRNTARMVEQAGKVAAAYLKPLERGEARTGGTDEAADLVRTLGHVAEGVMRDPARAIEAQASLASNFMGLWAQTLRKMHGEPAEDIAKPEPKDPRFADPEWTDNPVFDFIKQYYLITSRWAEDLVERAEGLDEHTREKARFYVKQLSSALAPSNFIVTNPELIRETMREGGENLVRGLSMLAEDVEQGHGELRVRMTDLSRFKVGENIAITPGRVVLRNDLIELIQYAPSTGTVLARPLVIVPPWINKFYILDLNPEKSFIKWCVDQGLTVFCISWVNPDERHRNKGFEAYMKEGVLAAVKAACEITGQPDVAAIGYCVGGTMLAVTLAYMAAQGDNRISSATFFTTQVDFEHAGELKVFVDEEQIQSIEAQMRQKGYLDGSRMASAFNMLRPNDLIWSNVVNTYLKGKAPPPFDLLYWNSDSTRMTEANHSFYLRNCYLNNTLSKGDMKIGGVRLDLSKVTVPIYNLATREDHIAPARSVFKGCSFFGGDVTFVLSGSGHIAGVVNPPNKVKYQYWTNGPATGRFEDWVAGAVETPGSWWPHWMAWLNAQAPARVPARTKLGSSTYRPMEDAPGTYVMVRV